VLGAGCGCAPNAAVQWPAFAALLISGLAILGLGLRRAATAPSPAAPRRRAAALVRPAAIGLVLVVLAAVVALASLDATGSLLALALGAVVASAGIGSSRLRLTRR
jgi:hypothetical protein